MSDERSTDTTPTERPVASVPARPTVDEMSEWSFPASDPPATWTWDPRPQTGDKPTGRPVGSSAVSNDG